VRRFVHGAASAPVAGRQGQQQGSGGKPEKEQEGRFLHFDGKFLIQKSRCKIGHNPCQMPAAFGKANKIRHFYSKKRWRVWSIVYFCASFLKL
jgi:hypothetical protein